MPSDFRTPGQLIKARLDALGWTRRTLAMVWGTDESRINRIIAGKTRIDADSALTLGEILGLEPKQLLDIQSRYDLDEALIRYRPDPEIKQRAALFGDLPIAEMVKRRWLRVDSYRDVENVRLELARLFEGSVGTLSHAAKRSSEDATPAQLAWLYRVKEIASDMLVAKFDDLSASRAITRLGDLLFSAEDVRQVPRILAESGIRFVIVEALPGSKIDGVCFWLNDSSPVVALSLRYDRIDNFWFVLRHELEHVRRRHGLLKPMLDTDLEGERAGTGSTVAEEEKEANVAAAEFCVPQARIQSFIARKEPFFAEKDIIAFSRTVQVHPGLVAGQLQRHTGRFDLFRKHQVKIRTIVAPGSMVDGWGDVAPT